MDLEEVKEDAGATPGQPKSQQKGAKISSDDYVTEESTMIDTSSKPKKPQHDRDLFNIDEDEQKPAQ